MNHYSNLSCVSNVTQKHQQMCFSPFDELKILLTLYCLVYCVRIVLSIPFLETGRYFYFTVFLFRSCDIGGKMRPAGPITFVGPAGIWSRGKSVAF